MQRGSGGNGSWRPGGAKRPAAVLWSGAMQLTAAQVGQYQRQGYLLLPGLVPKARLAGYESRFIAFAKGEARPVGAMKIMRDVMVVKGAASPEEPLAAVNKLINFEDDPSLYGYALEPALLAAVRCLIGPQLFSISTNLFNKPPGVDGRHPLHQDLRYFRIRPADKIIGVWTALGPTNRRNGCLAVMPGSHKGELLEHGSPDWAYVNAGFLGVAGLDRRRRVHVEMAAGDTLLFHPLLIHGSGRNRSAGCRRAISCHYAAADCESPVRDWRIGKQARRITGSELRTPQPC